MTCCITLKKKPSEEADLDSERSLRGIQEHTRSSTQDLTSFLSMLGV